MALCSVCLRGFADTMTLPTSNHTAQHLSGMLTRYFLVKQTVRKVITINNDNGNKPLV